MEAEEVLAAAVDSVEAVEAVEADEEVEAVGEGGAQPRHLLSVINAYTVGPISGSSGHFS